MELIAATIGVIDVTTRTSSHVWKLCNNWKDAPRELHHLRDDMVRTHEFFLQVRTGIKTARLNDLAFNP